MQNKIDKTKVKIFTALKTHGLKGFFKANLHVADEDFLELTKAKISFFTLNNDNVFEIENVVKVNNGFNVKFKNLDKIEDIENFIKNDFFIEREVLDVDFIPQDLIEVDVFVKNKDGKKEFYGKIVDYIFYKSMNSMMLIIEDVNKEKIMREMDEKFTEFNKEKNEIFLSL